MKKILKLIKKYFDYVEASYQRKMAEEEKERIEAGCDFCGNIPVCPECNRCYDPNCNAGCIFCRPTPKIKICKC